MSSDRKSSLRTVLWRTEPEFLGNREQWNELVARIPDSSVFLRHEWFDAAWRWAGMDAELYIIALLEGDRLMGVAPLILRASTGSPRHRRLSFLTVPDTQTCDILADPARRTEVLAAIFRTLNDRRDWDVLELAYLNPGSAEELAAQARAQGRSCTVSEQGTNPGIALEGTWESYYSRRSRRLKKGNNLIANKLKKGGHRFALAQFCGPRLRDDAERSDLIDQVVAVSANSWKRKTGLSLDFPGPNAFIRRLSELAATQGWLSVWRLEVDGRALATEYQLNYNGHVHALRSDFVDDAAELSPGTYLNWKMLESMFESSGRRYLMGPGDNAYKLRWAEEFDPVARVVIYGTTARASWLALLDVRIRPAVRVLRARWTTRRSSDKEIP